MNKTTLELLSKEELISIITSDKMWERKAFHKVLDLVGKKIESILDEQDKCDFMTAQGREEYYRLEKEYKKWSKIQDDL